MAAPKQSTPAAGWLSLVALVAASAATFLTRVRDLSYFKDDWYYIYDAYIAGPGVFREMFRIDRPARGFFFEAYYSLFGPHPLPYHLSAFIWRIVAALCALWLFGFLWPGQRRTTALMAVLFVLYPGYLWWISAIEYQPMIASLALQVLSIALTVKALLVESRLSKLLLVVGAVLAGWAYIWLVDYAIGMEVLRFICVYLILRRAEKQAFAWKSLLRALRAWAPYALIPLAFLIWRAFFFGNERKATDIGLQLGVLAAAPLETILRWSIQTVQSTLNVGLLAWVVPFQENFYDLRLRDMASALILAAAVSAAVLLAIRSQGLDSDTANSSHERGDLTWEAIWLGGLGSVFGILPIVFANRTVSFSLSHYALPASLAAAILLAGLISSVRSRALQTAWYGGAIALAVLTHQAVLAGALAEERAIQEFWWQVSWRAPALRPETLMVINYPSASIGDDGYAVMEAANLIYFGGTVPDETGLVHYRLSAVGATDANVKQVLVGNLSRETGYRSHTVNFDYGNVLVMSQPTHDSCVHVIDGSRPVLSISDPGNILLVAGESEIGNVLTGDRSAAPPAFAFGSEPEHGWCYYYEAADLALQRRDWEQAAALGAEAMQRQLTPEDQSEWLPFVQAYALLGDEVMVRSLSTRLNIDNVVRIQTCLNLRGNAETWTSLSVGMQALVEERFCRNVRMP
jgi:hypothetical protein